MGCMNMYVHSAEQESYSRYAVRIISNARVLSYMNGYLTRGNLLFGVGAIPVTFHTPNSEVSSNFTEAYYAIPGREKSLHSK